MAESDHIVSLQKRHEQTKNKPWLKEKDIRKSSNSSSNMETVSREFNNAKRSRSNTEFVTDEDYLKKTGVELSKEGKNRAIESENNAKKALQLQDMKDSARNILDTGNKAGLDGMKDSGTFVFTVSTIQNIVSVIKGEKTAKEAIVDTAKDTGKAAATGYGLSSALTVISHTLSYSSSSFIRALAESNVPGQVITAVMITGDTVTQYAEGKISTKQCMNKLQEKASVFAGGTFGGAIGGQILVPIPIVGAAVGVSKDMYDRLDALVAAKADVIIVDTAHGHSAGVLRTLKEIKQAYPHIPVIAGNVATAAGTEALIEAGADAAK